MNRQRTTWSIALGMIAGITVISLPFTANAQQHEKHINAEYSVSAETELSFDSGVGTITFERTEGDVMEVSIRAYKDDDTVFNKDGNVEDAELVAEQAGNQLTLRVSNQDGIQLDWVIKLPRVNRVETDLGVGEINGDLWTTDIQIDLGVGEVDLDIYGDYKTIKTDVGVGDSTIKGLGNIENNRFLMTANSRANSSGKHRVSVDTGVGDIDITVH
ncbi:hypothetical protein LG272_08905 [Pseudidiomarina marina]|uniref:Adhesin domain-containing protein n=1 Tax=Pseudidiomarina marina TaxID=502366 RepID=A0A432YKE5_9GAMM|nr:hypothetical protein [Pseudidiomarina marina]PHR63823.1 MAG: hypothetical protein COA51_09610 [Idiomarina sp.]RUO61368.1 hypothetical protein CWI76_03615 [Pseudidiomarina marina]